MAAGAPERKLPSLEKKLPGALLTPAVVTSGAAPAGKNPGTAATDAAEAKLGP